MREREREQRRGSDQKFEDPTKESGHGLCILRQMANTGTTEVYR